MPDNKDKNKQAVKAYKDSVRQAESGGDSTAKSPTSSATGLYQFTEATWKEMEKKLGKKLDIFSKKDQETAMNKLTELNVNALEKNGLPVTTSNLYMTHFLGVTGGPKFLKNLEKNPNELASKYVSAGAVKANENLFYNDNKPVTASELYNKLSSKVGGNELDNLPQQSVPQFNLPQEVPNTVQESTYTERPRLNRDLKPSKPINTKSVTDNTVLNNSPVEGARNILGLSGDLDFLPKDLNLAYSEEEQLNNELSNPDELVNIAKLGGNQKTISNTEPSYNKLIEFNEGGSHEENPHGGVPQGIGSNGKINTVEEGETKYNTYVFSDTLKVNDDNIESLFLPKEIAGKTFAEASKYINSILEDNPNDKIIKKTVEKQLDALTLGNEKARLDKEQLDVNLGNSLSEDLSSEPNQLFLGGFGGADSSGSGAGMNVLQGVGAAGNAIGDGSFAERYNYDPELKAQYEQTEGIKDGIAGAFGPYGQLFRGIEKAGKGLGTAVGGETGGDIASGILDPFSGQMETFKNKDATGWEKAGVIAAPFLSGVIAGASRKRSKQRIDRTNHTIASQTYQNDFEIGGDLSNIKFREDDINPDFNFIPNLGNYSYNQPGINPTEDPNLGNYISDNSYTLTTEFFDFPITNSVTDTNVDITPNTSSTNSYNPKGKNYLQYAPILGDYLNLREANRDKPEVERLNRIDRRFTPDYVDEAYLQNTVNNTLDNTVNALTNATNGSQGALRNNILAAGVNRNRGLSDAYFRADDINRGQFLQGQSFDLGVDQFNVGQDNQERDINARNRAAVEDRRRAARDTMFRDIGAVGREQTYDNRLYNLTGGYDSMGNYNPDNISILDQLNLLNQNNQKKKGGFLSTAFSAKEDNISKYEEEFNKRYK